MSELEHGLDVLAGRTRVVAIIIFAFLAASAGLVLVEAGQLAGSVDIEAAELTPLSLAATIVYAAYALILIVSVIVIGMWINRAHKNLRVAGIEGLEFTPGWAVGWFFVPIANLFKPLQAMRSLWNESHNQADMFGDKPDPKLTLWWGTWITGNIISNISLRFGNMGEGAQSIGWLLDLASTGLLAVCAWVLLGIVRQTNDAQRSMVGLTQTFS